jgi:3-phenylpropionate/cinnamic acid dioxygenase small subunit
MIQPSDAVQLLTKWWFAYDNALFDEWPEMWSSEAHFSCRTDTGQTAYEEFVNADVRGRDEVLAWQTDHRVNSPHPLRHNGTNVHLTRADDTTADFRSYIWVTQILGGSPSPLSTAIVHGSLVLEGGELRISDLNVVLDTEDSTVLAEKQAAAP